MSIVSGPAVDPFTKREWEVALLLQSLWQGHLE